MDYLSETSLLAAGAVVLVQELLKLRIVPLSLANRYPVPTNIVLSIIAAVVVVREANVQLGGLHDWLVLVGTIAVVAALTYNQLLGKWQDLRSLEG